MQVIIHIGTEKTGSTTLQEFMLLNRDVLLADGVYVPRSLGRANHRKLAVYCMNDDKSDDFTINKGLDKKNKRDRYRQKVADSLVKELKELDPAIINTVLISSEHFHSRLTDKSELERLKALFAVMAMDVKIICYLRKQSHLVESKYSTYLKSGGYSSFASMSKECVESNRYYNYDHFLKLWEHCFSIENISIREFGRDTFVENNLCLDFLDLAGLKIEQEKLSFPKDKNTSFSTLGIFMVRVINRVFKNKKRGSPGFKKRKAIVTLISNSFRGSRPKLMSLEDRNKIDSRFEKCNFEVSLRYRIQLFSNPNKS